MTNLFKAYLILLFISLGTLHADDTLFQPKSEFSFVNDEADLFSVAECADLEQKLIAYNDSTSTQIAVVTVKSLNGYAPSDYATRLGEQWGVGQSEKNNGIVILIKPRIGNKRGEVYIATGYGVEYILTDSRVGRIIDDYMIPHLPNNYYKATEGAISRIMEYLSGEFMIDDPVESNSGLLIYIALMIIMFIILIIQTTYFPYRPGARIERRTDDAPSSDDNETTNPVASPNNNTKRSFGGGSFGGGGAGRSF